MALTSPCRRICRYNGGTYCVGCKRHTDEIGRWFWMSEDEAETVMAALPRRRISPAGELVPPISEPIDDTDQRAD